jgi:hypothetical protein
MFIAIANSISSGVSSIIQIINRVTAENGDFLIAENGDNIIIEE